MVWPVGEHSIMCSSHAVASRTAILDPWRLGAAVVPATREPLKGGIAAYGNPFFFFSLSLFLPADDASQCARSAWIHARRLETLAAMLPRRPSANCRQPGRSSRDRRLSLLICAGLQLEKLGHLDGDVDFMDCISGCCSTMLAANLAVAGLGAIRGLEHLLVGYLQAGRSGNRDARDISRLSMAIPRLKVTLGRTHRG